MTRSGSPSDPPPDPQGDPQGHPHGAPRGAPHDDPRGAPRGEPGGDPRVNAPHTGSHPGGSRFQRLRMRRGAPPKDAVLRMEHFHVTAAEKRRREAMERSRGRLVITAGMFAAMFAVVCVRVAWVTVVHPVHAKLARETIAADRQGSAATDHRHRDARPARDDCRSHRATAGDLGADPRGVRRSQRSRRSHRGRETTQDRPDQARCGGGNQTAVGHYQTLRLYRAADHAPTRKPASTTSAFPVSIFTTPFSAIIPWAGSPRT